MPSPLNGFPVPAASPIVSVLGPLRGPSASPIGRRPPVGGPQQVSSLRPQASPTWATKYSWSLVVLTPFQLPPVESSPTPTLTRPSPRGKTQPYPGTTSPLVSRMSRCESIHGSSCRSLV